MRQVLSGRGGYGGHLAHDLPDGAGATTILRERLAPYPGADDAEVIRVAQRGEMREDPGAFVSWPKPGGGNRSLTGGGPAANFRRRELLAPGTGRE